MKKILLLLLFTACSSPTKKIDETKRRVLMESFTASQSNYKHLHNQFQVSATILNSKVIQVHLNQKRFYKYWSPEKYREEEKKASQDMSSASHFFVLLYTPNTKHNDLDKKEGSIWRVHLNYNGSSYKGKVKRVIEKLIVLKSLYPHITRFHRPYLVTFDIPMYLLEQSPSQLTLISPLGKAILNYKEI